MARHNTLTHNALANVLQVSASAGLLFLLYRYVNDSLGAAALGIWSVVLASASASRLADLGLSASVTRFVARYLALDQPQSASRLIETATLSLMLLLGVALPLLYYPLQKLLPVLLDVHHASEALAILPHALGSLWLTIVATVFQSGLDGCQRMDLRAWLVFLGQILMVSLAFVLIPEKGLLGLAWAQIGQGTFLLIAGWWLLRGRMRTLPWAPMHWSRPLFKEMLGYGANVQVATLLMLLFDPLTKALMAKFGGPSTTGYFEMANQVVLKIRAIIVAANQAIIPHVTEIAEINPERLMELYRKNLRVLIFISMPVFTVLYASSGIISWLLVGHVHAQLLYLLQLNTVAWLLNLFAVPAYFMNLGTGQLGWNTLTHVIMGLLNAGLGWILGQKFGAEGVAIAYGVALTTGSFLLVIAFQQRSGRQRGNVALMEHAWIIATCLTTCIASHYAWLELPQEKLIWGLLAFLNLLLAIATWMHPLRSELWGKLSCRASWRHE